MRNRTLLLAIALTLAGCGGGGASNPLAGSYAGTWSESSPAHAGAMRATIVSGTLSGTLSGGDTLTCTISAGATASYDLSGSYGGTPVTGSLWPTAHGVGGSFAPVGSANISVFTLARN